MGTLIPNSLSSHARSADQVPVKLCSTPAGFDTGGRQIIPSNELRPPLPDMIPERDSRCPAPRGTSGMPWPFGQEDRHSLGVAFAGSRQGTLRGGEGRADGDACERLSPNPYVNLIRTKGGSWPALGTLGSHSHSVLPKIYANWRRRTSSGTAADVCGPRLSRPSLSSHPRSRIRKCRFYFCDRVGAARGRGICWTCFAKQVRAYSLWSAHHGTRCSSCGITPDGRARAIPCGAARPLPRGTAGCPPRQRRRGRLPCRAARAPIAATRRRSVPPCLNSSCHLPVFPVPPCRRPLEQELASVRPNR